LSSNSEELSKNFISKCDCCYSKNIEQVYDDSFFNLPIMKCMDCLFHFAMYDEDEKNMQKYYNETYWPVFRNINNKKILDQKVDNAYLIKKLPSPIIKLIESTGVRKSLAYSQFRYLKSYLKGKTLFEIGPGEGFILELFEKNNYNVFGMEASKENLDVISSKLRNGKIEIGFAEDISKINKKFDVIILSHVLEHLVDFRKVLLNIKNLLVDDGIFFIEVPNCKNFEMLEHSIYTQPHLHHFTKLSLELLLEDLGFKIIKIDTFSANVVSLTDHFKYLLKWIFKIDHYVVAPENQGNNLRIIITHNK
jgi:2-polyprenyl-3-methyl-5-hydroxy-6-metoxy-1,4-benzoquinol methylase